MEEYALLSSVCEFYNGDWILTHCDWEDEADILEELRIVEISNTEKLMCRPTKAGFAWLYPVQ